MPVEYEKQYLNMTKHYSRYHGYAYDGVWAAALAIEEVGRKAHAYNLSLEDFSYRYNSTTYIIEVQYQRGSYIKLFRRSQKFHQLCICHVQFNSLGQSS